MLWQDVSGEAKRNFHMQHVERSRGPLVRDAKILSRTHMFRSTTLSSTFAGKENRVYCNFASLNLIHHRQVYILNSHRLRKHLASCTLSRWSSSLLVVVWIT